MRNQNTDRLEAVNSLIKSIAADAFFDGVQCGRDITLRDFEFNRQQKLAARRAKRLKKPVKKSWSKQ